MNVLLTIATITANAPAGVVFGGRQIELWQGETRMHHVRTPDTFTTFMGVAAGDYTAKVQDFDTTDAPMGAAVSAPVTVQEASAPVAYLASVGISYAVAP